MTKKIRLADVAAVAGVSTATVSRVLNAKSTVATGTKQLVLQALDELGYERPDALRDRSDDRVGIVAPDLNTPSAPEYIQELVDQLSLRDYAPILLTHSSAGGTEKYLQMLVKQNVSGVIFLSGVANESDYDVRRYLDEGERQIPYVTINGRNPNIGVPDFSSDDVGAVKDSVRHLYHSGHRSIGLITGPERFRPAQDMAMGYRQAMMEMCPDTDQTVLHSHYSVEGGGRATDTMLDLGVTGIICGSDLLVLGAIRQIRQRGLRVPEDVSVVGYDDSPLMAFTDPPLTSNRQPVRQISSAAVNTLVDLMKGGNPPRVPFTFQSELITRESSGAAPNQSSL